MSFLKLSSSNLTASGAKRTTKPRWQEVKATEVDRLFRASADVIPPPAAPGAGRGIRRPRTKFVFLDSLFAAPTLPGFCGCVREARKRLRYQATKAARRNLPVYDCDDFAIALKSQFARQSLLGGGGVPLAVGLVECDRTELSNGVVARSAHVLVWCILTKKDGLNLYFFEPQNINWNTNDWIRNRALIKPDAMLNSPPQQKYSNVRMVLA
ncbi:MAG: hypothetical protein ACKVYV_03380 [Limisphaerales bacterium]